MKVQGRDSRARRYVPAEAAAAARKPGEVVVGTLASGSFFGESSLLDALAAVGAGDKSVRDSAVVSNGRRSLLQGGAGIRGAEGVAECGRVLRELPRATASVTAREDALLLAFDAIEFVAAVSEYPEASTRVGIRRRAVPSRDGLRGGVAAAPRGDSARGRPNARSGRRSTAADKSRGRVWAQ